MSKKFEVYKFRKYEPIFSRLYLDEERQISRFLHKKALVEHIGSTAVPKLPGKGIIDIIVACPKMEIVKVKNKLFKIGYQLGESSDKARIFLKKEVKIKRKLRRFHVHIVVLNHRLWKQARVFRDYLIKNPAIARQYAKLKRKAIMKCHDDGEIYRKLKSKFINLKIEKALGR